MDRIGIVMPAHRAEATVGYAVKSVVDQSFGDWILYLVSDDGSDYSRLSGLDDPRIVHLSTPAPRSGAPIARNVAFDAMDTRYAALLDADDRFAPGKLEACKNAFASHELLSCAIDVVDQSFNHLRFVGEGQSKTLTPSQHKFVSISMDSMIAWDRTSGDPRFDPTLPNMADLDFLLRLYRSNDHSFHLGAPLHDYVKIATSMSNKPGMTEGMIASKKTILKRLRDGYYGFTDTLGVERFLEVSLEAEAAYPAALAAHPGLLFEDHLEPRLRETSSD